MMMRILVDTGAGNGKIKDGSMSQIVQKSLERLSPEAAYFYPEDGMRAGFVIFDMKDPSEIPQVTEPLFQELGAKLSFTPVMSADDLRKGLEAL
jgi:hypothetical protein